MSRKRSVYPSNAQWSDTVDHLLALEKRRKEEGDSLHEDDYLSEANRLGVSLSAVYKKMADARDGADIARKPEQFEFNPDWKVVVADAPNLFDAYLQLLAAGELDYVDADGNPILDADGNPKAPHYTTFWRAFRNWDGAVQAGLVGDDTDMQPHEPHLLREKHDVCQLLTVDLYTPKVCVVFDDGTWPDEVHWVSIRCHGSRAYLAEHLFFHMPTAEDIIALVGVALRGTTYDDGTFIGGRHVEGTRILCDNQANLVAELSQEKLIAAGVTLDPVTSYRAWENGQQEKSHLDTAVEALGDVPGKTTGPVQQNGKMYYPGADGTVPVITASALAGRLSRHATSYTTERAHEALDGYSPAHEWQDQQHLIQRIPDEVIAQLATKVTYKTKPGMKVFRKRRDGISFKHAGVKTWLGVETGAKPNRHRFHLGKFPGYQQIAVWDADTGEFIEFAEPNPGMSAETAAKIRERKALNRNTVRNARIEAARRQRVRNPDQTTEPDGPRPKRNNATKDDTPKATRKAKNARRSDVDAAEVDEMRRGFIDTDNDPQEEAA